MPSSTINTSEGLADYKDRIEAALTEHSGTITLAGSGDMPTSQIDIDEAVNITIGDDVVLKRLPENPSDYETSTTGCVRIASGGSGTISGGVIDANGSSTAIVQLNGGGSITLQDLTVRNAWYKQISINGDATLSNVSVSSDRSGAVKGLPTSFLADWEGNTSTLISVDGLYIGDFFGSDEGQMTKVARATTVRLTDIRTLNRDVDTDYSLVFGEELGYVIVKDCNFPRRVSHLFGGGETNEQKTIETLVFSGCTIGNADEQINLLHDHVWAENLIYHNCVFLNAGATLIEDETPDGLISNRIFVGCEFDTATSSTLINNSTGTLTDRVWWADCTFTTRGSGSWAKPADWATQEVTLPTGYDMAGAVGSFV